GEPDDRRRAIRHPHRVVRCVIRLDWIADPITSNELFARTPATEVNDVAFELMPVGLGQQIHVIEHLAQISPHFLLFLRERLRALRRALRWLWFTRARLGPPTSSKIENRRRRRCWPAGTHAY